MTKKNTHTITNLNDMIEANLQILKNGETIKEKREARKKIIMLEKLIKDVDYKLHNGKKYPERLYHSGPEPMDKEEVLKLIDSVDSEPFDRAFEQYEKHIENRIDLSGVSVGKSRFVYQDSGWSKPAFEGRKVPAK